MIETGRLTLEVFVFAYPGRSSHARLHASLEASDVGKRYRMMYHPRGWPPKMHWRNVYETACASKAEWVIILEDDCIVNRHLIHNASTWPAIEDERFGAGWLYNPAGIAKGETRWFGASMPPGSMWGTVAMLYRVRDLPTIMNVAWRAMGKSRLPWDHAIDIGVVSGIGKECAVHWPSLAEHPLDTPSVVGNRNDTAVARKSRTSFGTFDLTWKRGFSAEGTAAGSEAAAAVGVAAEEQPAGTAAGSTPAEALAASSRPS